MADHAKMDCVNGYADSDPLGPKLPLIASAKLIRLELTLMAFHVLNYPSHLMAQISVANVNRPGRHVWPQNMNQLLFIILSSFIYL